MALSALAAAAISAGIQVAAQKASESSAEKSREKAAKVQDEALRAQTRTLSKEAQRAAGRQVSEIQQDVSQTMQTPGGQISAGGARVLQRLGESAGEAGALGAYQAQQAATLQAERQRNELLSSMENRLAQNREAFSTGMRSAGDTYAAQSAAREGALSEDKQDQAAMAELIFGALCWVAREVLPGQWRDCRTFILFGPHPTLRKLYAKYGEATAVWIRPRPWAKAAIRPLFRYFARQGRHLNQKYPQLEVIQAVLP